MPVNVNKDDMGDVINDFYKSDAPQFKLSSEGFKTDILTDRKYGLKIADQNKKHKELDARMKYGKSYKNFTSDANSAKDRLRPGEVKKYNRTTGKWESNKD